MSRITCVGFGPFAGTCDNRLTPQDNPNWCSRCDAMRKEHIEKQFKNILKEAKAREILKGSSK